MRQEDLGDALGGSDSDDRSSADDSSEDLLGANYTGPLGAAMKWKRQCDKGEADELGATAHCYLHCAFYAQDMCVHSTNQGLPRNWQRQSRRTLFYSELYTYVFNYVVFCCGHNWNGQVEMGLVLSCPLSPSTSTKSTKLLMQCFS